MRARTLAACAVVAVVAVAVAGLVPQSSATAPAIDRADRAPRSPAAGASDESRDFDFPGADLARVPGTSRYVAVGASVPRRGEYLPYTEIAFADGAFVRRGRVDGDAWRPGQAASVRFPAGYWAERSSTLWTPVLWPRRVEGRTVWFLVYSAVQAGRDRRCIGYATSTSYTGGWRPAARPLFCPRNPNRWAIDADLSSGPNGRTWLTVRNGEWTRDRFTALGATPLTFSGRTVRTAGYPVELLRNDRLEWTHLGAPAGEVITIENPSAQWIGGSWYLFYSGNWWPTNRYATGVAHCGPELVDARCRPMRPARAQFAFAPRDRPGFRAALPASMRHRTLPGNKRGPGAFDIVTAPDGSRWASWNYLEDASHVGDDDRRVDRNSRIGRLVVTGRGAAADFSVSW